MKLAIDMSKPTMLYGAGVGLLMIASLILSNIPQTNLSQYVTIAYHKEIAAGLFAMGTVFGVIAMLRHLKRTKTPWVVPQSQVFISFSLFFVLTLLAVILAK